MGAAGPITIVDLTTCDDGNACTDDTCNAGACVNTFNTSPCDDGLFCTVNDTCDGLGTCVGVVNTCDDGVGCTDDSCDEGNDVMARIHVMTA
jgi:hypothetical protein